MAPASPSAIAAVPDRAALARLDSRGPAAPEDAGAGLPFAGLMAQAAEVPGGPEDPAPVTSSPEEGEPLPPGEPDPSQAAIMAVPAATAPPLPLAPEPVALATTLPSPTPPAGAAVPAQDPVAPSHGTAASRPAPEVAPGNPGMPPLPEPPSLTPPAPPVGPGLPEAKTTAPVEDLLPPTPPVPIPTGMRPPEPAFLAEIVTLQGAPQASEAAPPDPARTPVPGPAQTLQAPLPAQPLAQKPGPEEKVTTSLSLGGTARPTPAEAEAPPAAAPGPAQSPLPSQPLLGGHPLAEPALLRAPEPQGTDLLPVALLPLKAPAPPAVAAPLATPTPAPAAAPILTQVEGGVRWMLKGGSQEARLQLHPESLGQVTIHLKVEGGEVHARLWITEPASVQALQEARPHLELSLREQGLQLGSFDLQQGHRPFQETPSAPERPGPRGMDLPPDRQEAPAGPLPSVLNPHRVELYA